MRKILLVASESSELIFWRRVLEISTDSSIEAKLITAINDVNSLMYEDYKFAIVISNQEEAIVINDLMNELRDHAISIIVNKEYAMRFSNLQTLLKRGIRGVIDENLSIMTISKLLEIVELGGIQIDPKTFAIQP
ncbi:hypothetical protein [Solibacillus sp. NPDC093137]|uniref:hypothetical protein n=1 Tax=Solibacillus sp. NPDC093137 TaxID=3390678 RepID=UPI003D00EB5F